MPDSPPPPEAPQQACRRWSEELAPCQAALLTPPGRGAVATVLVVGPGWLAAVEPFFQTARGRTVDVFADFRIVYGNWRRRRPEGSAGGGLPVTCAEDVVLVRHGSERLEIHCHGGAMAAEAILEDLVTRGCEPTCGVDWLAGSQSSPLAGEALRHLVQAPTVRTAAILMDQAQGALDRSLQTIVDHLRQQRTVAARDDLAALLAHAHVGMHLVRPWRVVLSGPPNVGKSSVINALVGYQRAIVYPQPGTTRDVVRVATALDGWPMELADTAGVRDSRDAIEAEGIRRARRTVRDADLVLLIEDAAQALVRDRYEQLASDGSRRLRVFNKIDLASSRAAEFAAADCLATSAHSGRGIPELMVAIVEQLVGSPPLAGAAVPFTRQQVTLLQQAIDSCDRQDSQTGLVVLDGLMGGS